MIAYRGGISPMAALNDTEHDLEILELSHRSEWYPNHDRSRRFRRGPAPYFDNNFGPFLNPVSLPPFVPIFCRAVLS